MINLEIVTIYISQKKKKKEQENKQFRKKQTKNIATFIFIDINPIKPGLFRAPRSWGGAISSPHLWHFQTINAIKLIISPVIPQHKMNLSR